MSGLMKVKKCEVCQKFYDESKTLNCPFCGNYTTNTLNSNLNYNIPQSNLTQSTMFNNISNNKKDNKPMTFRRFLLFLGVCFLVTVVFLVPIIIGSNNAGNNKKTTNANSTNSNTTQVGTEKNGDISYDGEKVGTATEKQLENNKSLYTFEYTNLEDIAVNISFEFESGFVNKMSQYHDNDMLTFYDNTRLIGIMNFGEIDVDYIKEYGKERYFEDYLNTIKDRLDDVRLEQEGEKYVLYYKEKGSFTDEVNYQSIAIIDLNDGYGMDFSYAVSKDKVFDTSNLDLFIKTIKVND